MNEKLIALVVEADEKISIKFNGNPIEGELYHFDKTIEVNSSPVGRQKGVEKPRNFNRARLKSIEGNKCVFTGPRHDRGKNPNKRYKFTLSLS